MKKIVISILIIIPLGIFAQTQTSNNEKLNLQSPTSVSLFQSSSSNGVWASGTITADRWGIFEDATSAKERLTVKPGGNVGIGTSNPSARLDIQSNTGQTERFMRFRVSDALTDYLEISNTTGEPNQFIPLIKGYHQTDNRYALALMGSTSDAMDNGYNALINFNARRANSAVQNRPLFVWTNYDQKLMTMAANGNLGIGTTNPNSLFHLRNANGKGSLIIQGKQDQNIGNTAELILSTEHSSANHTSGTQSGRKAIVKAVADSNWGQYVRLSFLTAPNISSYPEERMSIAPNGNVSIGTLDAKGYKLAVAGDIVAEEIKVKLRSSWPDFVFENTYSLPSLKEVETHIQENGHLENIPSAKEVAENGIQLGEINAKLLQKIEELTLYMIEQNKKTEELQKEVALLKRKNIALEKKVK